MELPLLQGFTIAHMLACTGRSTELYNLVDVVFRIEGTGLEHLRR